MPAWNFADVWEVVAEIAPDRPAQRGGDRTVTWGEWDRRANALAADLLDAGLGHQAKVAAYLYNGLEYLEVYHAAFKAGLVPVNTNYRYGPEEIVYLFDNADAEAVVFHAVVRAAARTDQGPPAQGAALVCGGGRFAAPGVGGALRSGRGRGSRPGRRALGPVGRRSAAALHRRHDRHAQGRDVAPARPVHGAGRRRQPHAGRSAGDRHGRLPDPDRGGRRRRRRSSCCRRAR